MNVVKRLWFALPAVLRVAEHAASCTTFPGIGEYGEHPCLLIQSQSRGLIGSNGRSDQPTPHPVSAVHVDGAAGEPWDRPVGPHFYLRLTQDTDDEHDGAPALLDEMRYAAAHGACWLTIDVDATSAQHHIVASRPTGELPTDAAWTPCRVSAGDLGPYPARTARGYHRPDGSVFARFARDVAWWIGLDQRTAPGRTRPAEAVRVHGEQVHRIALPGTDREHTREGAGQDGWWRIDGDTWPWRLVDDDGDGEELSGGLFQTWGPDGEQRCTVCHAVNEVDHHEMPSMVGYGEDTYTACRRCRSTQSSDPMFGVHTHPAPWPPPRARQEVLDQQYPPPQMGGAAS